MRAFVLFSGLCLLVGQPGIVNEVRLLTTVGLWTWFFFIQK